MSVKQKWNRVNMDVCTCWENLLLSSADSQSTFGMLVKYLQEPPRHRNSVLSSLRFKNRGVAVREWRRLQSLYLACFSCMLASYFCIYQELQHLSCVSFISYSQSVSPAESGYHGVRLFDSQLRQFLTTWGKGRDHCGRQLIGEINAPHRGHK